MRLHAIDIAIIIGYFLTVILIGLWVSKRGAKNLESYFLGGKSLPWYVLGISDASGMFDISGTMVLVTCLFMYGLKSIWLPWVWPTFNQICRGRAPPTPRSGLRVTACPGKPTRSSSPKP